MKLCINGSNSTAVIQDRRQFLLEENEQEIMLSELLSYEVSVIPCNPRVNKVFYQQELEDFAAAPSHLARGNNYVPLNGMRLSVPTEKITLFLSDDRLLAFPSSIRSIDGPVTQKPLLSRVIKVSTSAPNETHKFDLLYEFPLKWDVSYTVFIDEKEDNFHFSGKYHIVNDTDIEFLGSEVSLLLGEQNHDKAPEKSQISSGSMKKTNFTRKAKKSKCSASEILRAFHIRGKIDIFPGVTSVPFAQGLIEPINKHFLVSFETGLPNPPQIIGENEIIAKSFAKGRQVIEIQNLEAQGLGLRLPPGTVQILHTNNPDSFEVESFYKTKLQLIEETEVIRIDLKEMQNLSGTREQVRLTRDDKKCSLTEEIMITVTNKHYYPVTTIVEDTLFRWKNWKITQTSTEFHPNGKDRARWVLVLPINGVQTIQYTVQYTWE